MFELLIKGISLTMSDMSEIHQFYLAATTAEVIMEKYNITNKDKAFKLGREVRGVMDKYDLKESEAIKWVMVEKERI